MTPEQEAALAALRAATSMFRAADAHRIDMIQLAQKLGVTGAQIREAMA